MLFQRNRNCDPGRVYAALFAAAVLLSPLAYSLEILGGRLGPADLVLCLLTLLFVVRRPDLFVHELCTVYGAAGLALAFWVVMAWVVGASADVSDLLSP